MQNQFPEVIPFTCSGKTQELKEGKELQADKTAKFFKRNATEKLARNIKRAHAARSVTTDEAFNHTTAT